jgi:hypothetical protein
MVPSPREVAIVTRKLAVSIGSLLLAVPATAFAQAAPAAPTPAPTPTPTPAPAPAPAPGSAEPAAPSATTAPTAPAPSGVQLMTLQVMRDKGILSQAEYDSAVKDLTESTGALAAQQSSVVMGKWATTMYGFVEDDNIYDTTRSLNDLSGNSQIARAGTLAGKSSRFMMGVRNSRIGFRLKAPDLAGGAVRTSAMLEMDFLGNQPSDVSEGGFWTNPTFRVRHFNLKVETPVVDVLAGQYWQLFGWQSSYQPNTVEIQGVPGEIYSRTPQVRISKTIHATPITIEMAVAATRPVQRDSGTPDGQGGVRLSLDSWTGVQTVGATGTQIAPLSIAVTGLLRHVAVNDFNTPSTYTNDLGMGAYAVDAYVPILPGTKDSKDNALSLNAEYAGGAGFADMYTGLTGGIAIPPYPGAAAGATPATADIDNGIVAYDANGGLHPIEWQSYLIGVQYYVPGTDGRFWVSGNYSHMQSANTFLYSVIDGKGPGGVRAALDWFDVNLFVDPTPALRVGAEYANFNDVYVDGQHAINHRFQLSGFYVF